MAIVRRTEHGSVYTRARSAKLWIRFRCADGSEVRKSSGLTDPDAAAELLEQEYTRQHELTFRMAVVDFFEVKERTLKKGTILGYKSNLRALDPFFGAMYLSDVNREVLKRYVAARRKKVSDTTVKRELAFLSTVYTHAVESMPGGPEINPVLHFSKKSMRERPRDRWLTADEYKRLLASCATEMHQDVVKLACLTGMRHGELLALRKPMFQLHNRRVILPGELTKNGKPRVVPLAPEALRTAEKVCENAPGDLFFWHSNRRQNGTFGASPFSTFAGFFKKARVRARLNDVRFHDLRHTFASWYVQAGGSLETLQRILGHGSLQMVQRYAYLDMDSAHSLADDVFKDFVAHTFRTNEEEGSHTQN